jgi:hypothetical protein
MADEIVTVDTLVTAHAAKSKETTEVLIQEKEKAPIDPADGSAPIIKDAIPPVDPLKDLLSEFNLESLDALKERLKPKDPDKIESPEEKEKRENLYRVEMQKYAVENGLMKPDEFVKLEAIKAKDDRSLVFENWLSDWKQENTDVDPEDVERQSKQDFEAEYKLDSKNEKTQARGLARIAKEAKEMRSPLENSYAALKEDFDIDLDAKSNFPAFNKKVSGFIQENIPAKIKLFETKDGDDTVPVEIDLTDEQRKDIFKRVSTKIMNSSTYQLFKKGDEKQMQALAKQEADSIIWADHREAGLNKIAETFLKRGDEKGYKRGTVGPRNPFPLVGDGKQSGGVDAGSAQKQVMDSLQGKK